MTTPRSSLLLLSSVGVAALLGAPFPGAQARAQAGVSSLPATSPTSSGNASTMTAPLAATGTGGAHAGNRPHTAQVSCANGQLTVRADDSSLNQILRSIARCTGMHITGGIAEQRVFGVYGPAAPATVLATLLDGTGSNMLLQETAADQPAQLILTPRTGGATPPPPSSYTSQNDPDDTPDNAPPQAAPPQSQTYGLRRPGRNTLPGGSPAGASNSSSATAGNQTPVLQPNSGSVITSPPPIRQPLNNVNGSPSNVSPTAGSYPTTDSVPLDSVATPSTTPPANGIVDAPNPPAPGSDTAAALNGSPKGTPGTTTFTPEATSQISTPGATNTTVPANGQTPTADQTGSDLTPQQVFEQLQRRQQQQQQQPSQDSGESPQ